MSLSLNLIVDSVKRSIQTPVPLTLLFENDILIDNTRDVLWYDRLKCLVFKINIKKPECMTTDANAIGVLY